VQRFVEGEEGKLKEGRRQSVFSVGVVFFFMKSFLRASPTVRKLLRMQASSNLSLIEDEVMNQTYQIRPLRSRAGLFVKETDAALGSQFLTLCIIFIILWLCLEQKLGGLILRRMYLPT